MGSAISASATHEAETKDVPSSAKSARARKRLPKGSRSQARAAPSGTAAAEPGGDSIMSILQEQQASNLRCRMRPVTVSDVLFVSQRACAQLMFRMPGVNDGDASLLRRMLIKADKSVTDVAHAVFVVEGSGLHEDLLACAEICPPKRDCHRWQREIAAAFGSYNSAHALQSTPLRAAHAAASAAKQDESFDKQFRKPLEPLGLHEIAGTQESAREVLARVAAVSSSFEDAARSAAYDLDLVLRQFSVGNRPPDPSILRGKHIVFAASNAQRSRGYAITSGSQYVLWHRPSCMAPLGQIPSFSSSSFSHFVLPRLSRHALLPQASANPALLCNDVILWEGLYKQICMYTECAIEAIMSQHLTQSVTEFIAPPLATRIERGGFAFLFMQESPTFGITGKQIGQLFASSDQTDVVFGFDPISTVPTYKPYTPSETSNLSQFTALTNRKLYANVEAPNDASSVSGRSLSSAAQSSDEARHCRFRVDSFSFNPGLIVYSIPGLQPQKKRTASAVAVGALFIQPMWLDVPLMFVSWTSKGKILESVALTLPSAALLKFCVSCEDEENHPNFAAAVSVSCEVDTSYSNVRSRPATASDTTHESRATKSFSTKSISSRNKFAIGSASLIEMRWSMLALSSMDTAQQSASQWAINSVKSLCLCADVVGSCVRDIVSSVEGVFSNMFSQSKHPQRNPCRSILELLVNTGNLRDSHGCCHFSFLPVILKKTSMTSKASLGILYADLICQVSANAIFTNCTSDSEMRLALQAIYSLVVDESNINSGIKRIPRNERAPIEPQPWKQHFESWWENTVSTSSCARALHLIKMLPLFQAEFGTSRANSSCILETLLENIWYASSTFSADSPRKHSSQITRAEFYLSWIRAMAARTLQLLFLTEPVDWVDLNSKLKHQPSPSQYQQPLGWYAHFHHKASTQRTAAFPVLDESWSACEIKGYAIVRATTFCELFCRMRFLLSSDFVSKVMRSRSVEVANLPHANNDVHQDPDPYEIPREYETADDFMPKPTSSIFSRQQQNAADLLDIGPLNFNERSQRIPLASTFGCSSWIFPVYFSPIAPSRHSSGVDVGLELINRLSSLSTSDSGDDQNPQRTASNASKKLFEPQNTLECVQTLHGLVLKLLAFTFAFDLQFVLNGLADSLLVLYIIGSVQFDHENGTMIPLNRRSSQMSQDIAATLYLRSMASSRLNTGASLSMFRMMCDILSKGQAKLVIRNYMPIHIRKFLLEGYIEATDVEEREFACVALTDAVFAKILNTHVVWTLELGFSSNDQVLLQACKRAELCNVESVRWQSLDTGDSKTPMDWMASALACPLIHTYSEWLSSCNPEAPLNDIVVISSTKSAPLLRATAQALANSYSSAVAASALSSVPLDVSCVLVGYASMCCKFFGEWACIEKLDCLTEASGSFCPCQMLFGVVACCDLHLASPLDAIQISSSSNAVNNYEEFAIQESYDPLLWPCICDMLTLLTHHEHGDKLTSYDPALLLFCMCPSRAFCDVSFKHLGHYVSDSTMHLVESSLHSRKFKRYSGEGFENSEASLISLNASSCLFVGDQSMLRLLSKSSGKTDNAGVLQCLCLDGCLNLTGSFMSKLSLLECAIGLECLVLPSFEQSSVLMGNFTEIMQEKVKFRFDSPFTFDEFVRQMKHRPEEHDVVDQLGYRSVQIVDPSLQYVSNSAPRLPDGLQQMLLRGYREDAYRLGVLHQQLHAEKHFATALIYSNLTLYNSAHLELMGRFAIATAWCREMRKQACAKEVLLKSFIVTVWLLNSRSASCLMQAIMFERNRTKMFAANQWREIDNKTGKVKSDEEQDDGGRSEVAAIEDGSTNLWASNEKIKNVSVMMGRLEKMAQATAVVRDVNSANSATQYVSKDEVFNSVVDAFREIQENQDRSRYVSLSGNLMVMLRQQKKDYYLRQLCTRACIRVALLHRHVRISARLCVEGQGRAKKEILMHIPSEQSAEYCRHMLNLVANSFEGPGCDGESIIDLLRCTPNLLHLAFVRAHPFSSSRLMDLMALRMSKTLMRMRQMWSLWDEYKTRLGRMNFQRSIHYERVPVKESIIKDHIGFHDRHCIIASKYLPKLVFLDLGGLKHISDMGRSAFFVNCTRIQAVVGSDVNSVPVTNECLLTLVCRMLPPLEVLFPYLSKGITDQIDALKESEHSVEKDVISTLAESPGSGRGMIWSLREHLANQHVENMSRKEREEAVKAKADQERKEKLLQQVAFRFQTRRNVLHCKAAVTSFQGKTARLRWIRLNEMANFNPMLRDTIGLSSKSVMAPETGQSKFGEPRYEFADSTPSMLASSLLRIRFQVLQLSVQCCQTPNRIKANMLRVKNSNRPYDDPFVAPEEIFGDPSVLKEPCQVFIKVIVEGQPDRRASRVKGLRLSHDKYFTSCLAGPIDVKSTGDCLVPIQMRQTGYLVIPLVSSRIFLEIRCQSYITGAQMITAVPMDPLQMPYKLDEPVDVNIGIKYAPKFVEEDDIPLNSGLQQAYFQNKHFILNGGMKSGFIQAEMTAMSPWQVDLMVAQSQSKKKETSIEKTNEEGELDSESKKPEASPGIRVKTKNVGVDFDPDDAHDCKLLSDASIEAFPLKMRLYNKYEEGNIFAESILNRDRLSQGDDAIVRCRAPSGLSSMLVGHAAWEIFKKRQEQARKEMMARWDKRGFIQKFLSSLSQDQDLRPSPMTIDDDLGLKKSDDTPVPVSLEGIEGKVDARAYLLENRDLDSDFEDVDDEPAELELSGTGGMQSDETLMISSIGRLVEYCLDTVTAGIVNEMTYRRTPFIDFRHVRCLELDNSIVTDKFFLDCFDLLIGLRSLSIAGCKRLTSATMLCIAQSQSAPYLQFLDVSRVCDWDSEIVASLFNNARAVIELFMDYDVNPTLTDGCVLLMSQNLKGLRLISLNGVQSLANESVSGLMEQARNLRSVSIEGLGFMNDLALQYAPKCIHLTFLSISFAILVTDEGLRHIARCRQLRTLMMQNLTQVTDNGLELLGYGCGRLECLDVIGCERLSPRGPDAVVQLCPFLCSVSVDATPEMRAWKKQVEGVGITSNVRVVLNFAAPT